VGLIEGKKKEQSQLGRLFEGIVGRRDFLRGNGYSSIQKMWELFVVIQKVRDDAWRGNC
jgi:hypothetical protein